MLQGKGNNGRYFSDSGAASISAILLRKQSLTYETNLSYVKTALLLFAVANTWLAESFRGHLFLDKTSNLNIAGVAQHVHSKPCEPVGPCGLQQNGTIWVSDNGTGVSTLIIRMVPRLLVVTIPTAARNRGTGNPHWVVFNNTPFFK